MPPVLRSGTIPAPRPVSGSASRSRGLVVENSRRSESEFRTLVRRQSHSSSQFQSCVVHQSCCAQSCRRHASSMTHQPCARAARFAKRPRHRSYTPTFPGSSPGASTNISPVAQWQSARPITGRPRFDTVRENQQPQATVMTTIFKPGRLAAASPSLTDPERSSLRRLGNGLLIRAQEVQLLPGPPTTDRTHD